MCKWKNLTQRYTMKTNIKWYEKQEKAGSFWLNLTIFLVSTQPKFILNIIIAFVTFVYFATSKEERDALRKFYTNLYRKKDSKNPSKKMQEIKVKNLDIYSNFYHFGWAICDKIATWQGKIKYEDLVMVNSEKIRKELDVERGSILVMSHFGNVEITRALSIKFKKIRIVAFMYQKNSKDFLNMLDKLSNVKVDKICVDEIDMNKIMELKNIVDSGGHIGIMGDRVALGNRNVKMDFLGIPCYFPQGAFIIARILGVKTNALWCEKINNKYHIELETFQAQEENPRDIKPLVEQYVHSLEKRALRNPKQWFTFYDFWNEDIKGQ